MQTHKEISDNPAKTAVTSPTDKKELKEDINRKMRLYSVFQALSEGKYPSNAQIDKTLTYGLRNSPIQEKKLSSEGRELVDDFRSIIETALKMVKQKNADELFQNFLYSTRKADSGKLNPKNVINAPASGNDVSKEGQEAAENLKVLGKLLFTNSEVRKLLKDIGLLGRDMAADGAVKVAERARPNEDQLNQIDEPAPDNQWIGKNGEVRGPNDSAPDTGLADKRDQVKEKAQQAKSKAQTAKNEAQSTAREAQAHGQEGRDRVQGAYDSAPGDNSQGPSNAEREAAKREGQNVAQEKKDVAQNKMQELKNRIPGEHKEAAGEKKEQAKDKARELRGRTTNYLKEKVPEERQDKFIYRLKKVVVEQQRHDDYQDAVDFFLSMAENYKGHAKSVAGQTEQHANRGIGSDPHYNSAWTNLRTLLERFANNSSMQPIFDSLDQIYADVKNDDELRRWFSQLDKYVRRVLQEPGFIMKDECDRQGRELRENGKGFFSERYRPHREAFTNSVQEFFQAYADDPLNVQFGQDWKTLLKDLALDGDNNLTYKPELWQDVRGVILPELLHSIGYVPLPRIEYTDNAIDLVIENLILDAPNLLPNAIEMEIKNYFKLSAYSAIKNDNAHSIWVSFTQIQTDIKDVAFYFKKKQGFPKISDHGIADVTIGGKGINGKIHLSTTGRSDQVFKVNDVTIKIDSLKFKIRDAKHQFLYSMIRPLAGNLIKNAVAKAMQLAIRSALDQLNQQLSDIKERLEDAKGRDDITRTDVLKNVFAEKKAKGAEAKEKADERNAQFQITANRSSKLVDYETPGNSMVRQQGEREKLIHAKEHGWKSPAFDWVSELEGSDRIVDDYDSSRGSGHGKAGLAAGAVAGAAGVGAAGRHGHHDTTSGTSSGLTSGRSTGLTPGQTTGDRQYGQQGGVVHSGHTGVGSNIGVGGSNISGGHGVGNAATVAGTGTGPTPSQYTSSPGQGVVSSSAGQGYSTGSTGLTGGNTSGLSSGLTGSHHQSSGLTSGNNSGLTGGNHRDLTGSHYQSSGLTSGNTSGLSSGPTGGNHSGLTGSHQQSSGFSNPLSNASTGSQGYSTHQPTQGGAYQTPDVTHAVEQGIASRAPQ